MLILLLKASGIWLLLMFSAIMNAALRDKILQPWLGSWSLPISGITLCLLIFLITFIAIPLFATRKILDYWWIGTFWLALTVSFEFLFGHYVMGKSWNELLTIFDIQQGNLMILVFLAVEIAPYFAAKLRSLI